MQSFKIILLGDSNVGKTCLSDRLIQHEFNGNARPSITNSFASCMTTVKRNPQFDSQTQPVDDFVIVNSDGTEASQPRDEKKLAGPVKIRLNVWDTVGTERFQALNRQYYTDSAASIIVYDVTDQNSFESVL